MAIIGMRDICWGFGGCPLLENITLQIEKGERVCLVGRNGVGKSTMLKLFSGELFPDSGTVWGQQGITVAVLKQDVPPKFDGTIFEVIAESLGDVGKALAEHNRISRNSEAHLTGEPSKRRDELQHMIDSGGGWELSNQIENVLSRTRLNPEDMFAGLSAGIKRLTLFARALACNPDLLLLDEPTNHLDIDTIIWMEEYILRHIKTLLFITHDRAFLKNIANRIIELDRGRLISYGCNYTTYLKRRQDVLDAEEKQNWVFDKKLSQEEAWIRKGIKARRTRNEGRVRRLEAMRLERQTRLGRQGAVKLDLESSSDSGKIVIEAEAT